MKKYIGMLIAVGLCSSAWAAIVTVNASDDAWTLNGANANGNFGTSTEIRLGSQPSGRIYHSFLKFDISGITETVTSATLHLRPSASINPLINLGVYAIADNTWTETSVTWNNQPAEGSLLATHGAISDSTWFSMDVTASIAAAVGNNDWSALLRDIDEANLSVDTYAVVFPKEFNGGEHTPYLEITTIPEPAALGLVALFGGAIFGIRRFFLI